VKKLIIMGCVVLIVAGFLLYKSQSRYLREQVQLDTLRFYRDRVHSGTTRADVQKFLEIHPVQNSSEFQLQHPPRSSLSYPLGEVSGPWYCSRAVRYLQFDFDGKTDLAYDEQPSPMDHYRSVELETELQDCL
jgi:hypothetical protein